jgi:hypothetical protein
MYMLARHRGRRGRGPAVVVGRVVDADWVPLLLLGWAEQIWRIGHWDILSEVIDCGQGGVAA